MDDAKIPQKTPESWLSALERAEADLAAGRVVEGNAVHRLLDDAMRRLADATSRAGKNV